MARPYLDHQQLLTAAHCLCWHQPWLQRMLCYLAAAAVDLHSAAANDSLRSAHVKLQFSTIETFVQRAADLCPITASGHTVCPITVHVIHDILQLSGGRLTLSRLQRNCARELLAELLASCACLRAFATQCKLRLQAGVHATSAAAG
jgi:hypothetical protein